MLRLFLKFITNDFVELLLVFIWPTTSLKTLREVDEKSNIESMDIKIEW